MTVLLSKVSPHWARTQSVPALYSIGISVQFLTSEPLLSVSPFRILPHTCAAQPPPMTQGVALYVFPCVAPTFLVSCSANSSHLSTLLSVLCLFISVRPLLSAWASTPCFMMGNCSLIESQGKSGIHSMCFPSLQNYAPVGILMPQNSYVIYFVPLYGFLFGRFSLEPVTLPLPKPCTFLCLQCVSCSHLLPANMPSVLSCSGSHFPAAVTQ